MNDEEKTEPEVNDPVPEDPTEGVNLKLIYSLIALAILSAITVAFFIVAPFYHRH
jgi:hypothetical protein